MAAIIADRVISVTWPLSCGGLCVAKYLASAGARRSTFAARRGSIAYQARTGRIRSISPKGCSHLRTDGLALRVQRPCLKFPFPLAQGPTRTFSAAVHPAPSAPVTAACRQRREQVSTYQISEAILFSLLSSRPSILGLRMCKTICTIFQDG